MSQEMGMAILRDLKQTRQAMESYANQPIVSNYRVSKQYADQVQQIEQVNKL